MFGKFFVIIEFISDWSIESFEFSSNVFIVTSFPSKLVTAFFNWISIPLSANFFFAKFLRHLTYNHNEVVQAVMEDLPKQKKDQEPDFYQ